jgi:methyl-accepting chemotaxis protein
VLLLKYRNRKSDLEDNRPIQGKDNRNIDGQVQVAADQLKGVVEQMKIAAITLDQTSASSKESTVELMSHSEKTVEYTIRVSDKMKMIESSALNISASSQEIHADSQSSYDELMISWQSLNNLQLKMNQLQNNHNILIEQMNSLVNHSNKINAIIHSIGDISQRTKILALNAAIEAARAGEHGKGFSVVANEVGQLANQTSAAVEETRQSIHVIQDEISRSTNLVTKEAEQVEHGSKELGNLLNYLNSFKEKLSHITKMVSDSSQDVDAQTESLKEISSFLEQISKMSMDNKDLVYTVTLDIEKQHESTKQILTISDTLTKTSDELQSIIKSDYSMTDNVEIDATQVEAVKDKIASLLLNPNLLSMESELHKILLDQFISANKQIEAIWSNRLDGTFVYSNPPAGLVNAKARPWFTYALTNEAYVSDFYTSALTKNACITLSFPIFKKGEIIGVLGADLAM